MRREKILIVSMVATASMTSCRPQATSGGSSHVANGDSNSSRSAEATGETEADAGGTAKPPAGGCVRGICPPVLTAFSTFNTPAGPLLPVAGAAGSGVPAIGSGVDNGFEIVGQVQAVRLNEACSGAPGQKAGGSVTINGIVITVPSDTIVQLPANTMTFADTVCPGNNGIIGSSLAFDGSGGTRMPAVVGAGQPSPMLPSVEMRAVGNIVGAGGLPAGPGSPHIASLLYASQMSANSGSGYIAAIDYADGSIYVSTAGGGLTRLLINDPIGRYGRRQTSPDARFSVDTANPTIKSGATGYPMCVPRVAPSGKKGVETDPRCPQRNRPTGPCRTFSQAGLSGQIGGVGFPGPFRVPGADISGVPIGGFCSAFVMKAIKGMPGTVDAALIPGAVLPLPLPATEPDPREQAPFEVGDFIIWQGTLVRGGNTPPANPKFPTTSGDLVWVHTIEANVGIFTQPRTLPAYIAIGKMVVGVDPQPTGIAILGVETTARLVLEASTSDVGSIVDVYFDDKGFELARRALAAGGDYVTPSVKADAEYYRWLTPESMTGTLADQASAKIPFATSAQPFGGGIETQYTGPQPGRARIQAIKIPAINTAAGVCPASGSGNSMACGITQSPTRYIRAVLRSLCAPAASGALGTNGVAVPLNNLDGGNWYDINGAPFPPGSPAMIGSGPSTAVVPADGPNPGTCLERAQFANGLYTGQYMAPVGEYIFPENTIAGFPVVPANTYQMGFLVYGENGVGGGATAPQVPKAW